MAASVASNQYAQGSGSVALPTLTAGKVVLAVVYAPGSPQVVVSIGTGAVTGSWEFLGLVNGPQGTGLPGDLEVWAFYGYSSQASPVTFTPVMGAGAPASVAVVEVSGIAASDGKPRIGAPLRFSSGATGTAITAPSGLTLATQDEFVLTAAMQYPTISPPVNAANGYTYLDSGNFFGYQAMTTSSLTVPTFSGVSTGPWVCASIALYAADVVPLPQASSKTRVPAFTAFGFITPAAPRLRSSVPSYTVKGGTGVNLVFPAVRSRSALRFTSSVGFVLHPTVARMQGRVRTPQIGIGSLIPAARPQVLGASFAVRKFAPIAVKQAGARLAVAPFVAAGNFRLQRTPPAAQGRPLVPPYTVTTNHGVSLHLLPAALRSRAAAATIRLGVGVAVTAARVVGRLPVFKVATGTGVKLFARAPVAAVSVPPFEKVSTAPPHFAKVSGRVIPYAVSKSPVAQPAIRARASVMIFSVSCPTGLAAQVLVATPYNDGVTVFYPEYSAVGTTGWLSTDPSLQLEGSEA